MWHLLNNRITVMEGFKFLGLTPIKQPMEANLCNLCISTGAAGRQDAHAMCFPMWHSNDEQNACWAFVFHQGMQPLMQERAQSLRGAV